MVLRRVFLWTFFLCIFSGFSHEQGAFRFVENKGQWNKNVRYRVDLSGGVFYLEDQKQTLVLYDQSLISNYHQGIAHLTHPNMMMQYHVVQMELENSQTPTFQASNPFTFYHNYFFGKNPKDWVRKVYPSKEVMSYNVYPGIHQKWYTHHGQLKYDFIVMPQANPNEICMVINGADDLTLKNGKLVIETAFGRVTKDAPVVYQQNDNGSHTPVECRYQLKKNRLSFVLGKYDPSRKLIIDPTLIFSTFSGSTANNFGYTATFDSEGYLYSGSTVFGASGFYPTTLGAFQRFFKGGSSGIGGTDIGITKYAQDGTTQIYSTLIGGNADEMPHSLYVNTRDELYLFGTTGSENYPVTRNAFDTTFHSTTAPVNLFNNNGLGVLYPRSCDLIVTRFNNDGSDLIASTFVGGNANDGINNQGVLRYNYADEVRGEIEIDFEDNVYVATCTQSTDFPIVGNTFQPNKDLGQDGVIFKMSSDLSQILWSSYYGGDNEDALYSLSLTKNGDVYVAGGTNSTNLPAFSNFFFSTFVGGRSDGYMGRISADGTTLMESSYLGTTDYDQIYFIETDRDENVYLLGQTESQGLGFVVNLTPQTAPYLSYNAGQFVIKFDAELDSIWWSTRFGHDDPTQPRANPNISPTAFLVDLCNSIYISGWGGTTNQQSYLNNFSGTTDSLFVTADAFQDSTDGSDFYLFVLSDDATTVNYASFYGGNQAAEHVDGGTSRFDRQGKIYQSVCAGCGGFSDFPIFPTTAWSDTNWAGSGGCNNAVFKMDFLLPIVAAEFRVPERACAPYTFNPLDNSLLQNSTNYFWDFGDGTTSTDTLPQKTFSTPGRYEIRLALSDTSTCNLSDTLIRIITIENDTTTQEPATILCLGDSVELGKNPRPNNTYEWYPSQVVLDTAASRTSVFPNSTQELLLIEYDGVCRDTIRFPVNLDSTTVSAPEDTILCSTNTLLLTATLGQPWQSVIWSRSPTFSDTLNPTGDSAVNVQPRETFTNYYVKLINPNGCMAIDSFQVTLSDFALQAENDTLICRNDSVWIGAFSLNPLDTLSYSWTPTNYILTSSDSQNILVYPIDKEAFIVRSENRLGCVGRDTIAVSVSTLFPDSVQIRSSADTIFRGRSVQLQGLPNSGSGSFQYEWRSAGNLISSDISIDQTLDSSTTFTLSVIDSANENCRYDTEYRVEVIEILCAEPELFVPSAFSPNGDGLNDQLGVFGKNIKDYNLTIYNRWGELIVELKNATETWDGTLNGEPAPEGVYYFEADITCIDDQTFYLKGDVSLLR